jgi:hypothetical protein
MIETIKTNDPRHPNNRLVTPPWLLDVARRSLRGEIVFDPYSSELSNRVVRAQWFGSLAGTRAEQFPLWASPATWINPPYGRGLCRPACDRVVAELAVATFPLVMLTNFDHSTDWCRALLRCPRLTPVLLYERVLFLDPVTLEEMPTTGSKPQVIWFSDACDPNPWFEHGSLWERIPEPGAL